MREVAVEFYLVQRAREIGWIPYKFVSPGRAGVTDRLLAGSRGRIVWVEIKAPGEIPGKGQLREHDKLRALGHDVRVIDSKEGVDKLIEELKDER